jgi:hypothetical protein
LIEKAPVDIVRLLLKGIGWLSWGQLKAILEITRGEFRAEVERKFVEDLIIYLYYRITDAWHRVFFSESSSGQVLRQVRGSTS